MAIETYIIVIKDNEASEKHALNCKKSLELNKVSYNVFDAVVPETLDERVPELQWNDTWLTPTEKACFASHYLLWKKCAKLNKRIVITEHDSIMIRPYPEYPRHTAFIGFTIVREDYWPTMHGSGYILKPEDARYLISDSINRINRLQVDDYLGNRVFNYEDGLPFERHKCLMANNMGPVTIDHGKTKT